MMAKISVILPIYNRESCLRETLDSIVNQTYKNLEIICINDGSTDQTLAILNNYAHKDKRFIICSQENGGPAVARNHGLDIASGEYVMMLDADDIYSNDMIDKLYQKAVKTKAEITICRCVEYDNVTHETNTAKWTIKEHQLPASDVFSSNEITPRVTLKK